MAGDRWCDQFGAVYVNETPLADTRSQPLSQSQAASLPPPRPASEVFPGVFTMAGNFAQSMAGFAAGGFRVVKREKFNERLAVCGGCPLLSGTQCQACGCFVHAKAWLAHEACPQGKWLAES